MFTDLYNKKDRMMTWWSAIKSVSRKKKKKKKGNKRDYHKIDNSVIAVPC